jgi:hypothetical protein
MANFITVKVIRLNDQLALIDRDGLDLSAIVATGTIITSLSEVCNVTVSAPSASDVLTWNGTEWTPKAPGAGDSPTISDLSSICNVTITDVCECQILKYDGSEWVNTSISVNVSQISAIDDVAIASPSANDVLTWSVSASQWQAKEQNLGAATDYITHIKSPFGNTINGYDNNNSLHFELGPLVVVDTCGNLVYK